MIESSGILYSSGVQIGEVFWIFGGTRDAGEYLGHHTWPTYLKKSVLYHIRKKTWVKGNLLLILFTTVSSLMFILGPDLPQNVFLLKAPAVSLNSAHVVIIGANVDYEGKLIEDYYDEFKENYFLTLVYDFRLNIWIKWARLPIAQPEIYDGFFILSISAVIFDNKYGNR